MDDKLSEEELIKRLDAAQAEAEVGALYRHYKGNDYKVIDLAILESDNSVCVIYQAQYGKRLTFIRPVSVWCETVDFEGKSLKRFSRI